MSDKELIFRAASVRGEGRFKEAIDLVDSNRDAFEKHLLVVALLQAFYAAVEMGIEAKARSLAHEIAYCLMVGISGSVAVL